MNLYRRLLSGNTRSALVKKNIIASFLLKGISILISLQVVPLTINYVNSEQYGIWLTLSSLVAWFYFFDIGFTHGFRNRFTEARARGDNAAARMYVSTTYAALAIVFTIMISVVAVANRYADWSNILNIDPRYNVELSKVFIIITSSFGLNIVFSTFTTMLTADQKPAISSFIQVLGQAAALITIFTLTKLNTSGNLTTLAFVFSGIPVVIVVVSSIILFNTKYRDVVPSFKYVKLGRVRDILGLGIEFFIITTSMLFIFNLINIIISRILGPESVTEYNIAYKYFNALFMFISLILNPFWSAFTDAYTRKDYTWMTKMFSMLEKLWLITIPILSVMYLVAPYFYCFWVGDTVSVSQTINISMAVYTLFLTLGNIYMYMINGIGKVRIQLIIYMFFAIIAYPIMTFMCKQYGITGLLLIPTIVYAVQGLLCRIQLKKILNNTATGFWNK